MPNKSISAIESNIDGSKGVEGWSLPAIALSPNANHTLTNVCLMFVVNKLHLLF